MKINKSIRFFFSHIKPQITLLIALMIILLAPVNSLAQNGPLRTPADARGFYIGAAVDMSPFRSDSQYLNILSTQYNIIVAENAFKMDATRPSQTTFNFTDTDALANFAQANNMKLRGHTLVWHNQLPGWLTSGNFTRDDVIAIMRDHIQTMVSRYRGIVVAWDVVNEAIDDSTNQLRNSFWYQKIGPDYINMAFQFAREADPDVKLYYNDYSIEGMSAKSTAVYNLVSSLKSQGVPINGVGWQMHQINGFRINTDNQTNAQRLAALGLDISMTEMDVRIQLPTTADELQQQAQAYSDSINFCLAQPNCKALVTWGFTDRYSWIPGTFSGYGDALPYDSNYQPKPAYFALLNGLTGGQPPPPTPPPAPTGLTATAGNGQVTLNWGASSGATSYNVKRSTTSGGPYAVIASNLTSTSFTNTGLTNGTTYYYVTSAVNAAGESPNSAQASATPQGSQPPPMDVLTATGSVASSSNPWWSELDVTINHTAPLTALTITITVQKTTGVTGTSQYSNFPGNVLTSNRTENASKITYTFNLAPGQTLGAGNNRLVAGQFNGNGTAHPYAGDTWSVTYTASGGTPQTLSGTF
ncbi:MAG: endo-1,4-beta-xylanase [Blastocatellia bacterium]|nr:endo-1,4-beta-xylanase [Blastocatellia bacterium]